MRFMLAMCLVLAATPAWACRGKSDEECRESLRRLDRQMSEWDAWLRSRDEQAETRKLTEEVRKLREQQEQDQYARPWVQRRY